MEKDAQKAWLKHSNADKQSSSFFTFPNAKSFFKKRQSIILFLFYKYYFCSLLIAKNQSLSIFIEMKQIYFGNANRLNKSEKESIVTLYTKNIIE